jgi:hypothetical protein
LANSWHTVGNGLAAVGIFNTVVGWQTVGKSLSTFAC